MGKIADNPYPGSRAFEQADQALFFGRAAETAAITNLWMTNRLTIVSGSTASGKTSVLQAGVYPSMPVKRSRVLPVGTLFYGMTFPFPALAEQNPFTFALLRSWAPEEVATRLAGLSISDFVGRWARRDDGATYTAIDQVDDLMLGVHDGAEAEWGKLFLAELTQAMADHPRLHMLLVTRNGALAPLTSAVGGGAHYAIADLTLQEAVEAVTGPAAVAGRIFTEEAANAVIDDLRGSGLGSSPAVEYVAPWLLQTVCRNLWENLPPDDVEVSEWAVADYRDADAALAAACGQVISEVAALHDIPFKDLHMWLTSHFVIDTDARGGAQEGKRTTAGQPNSVLRSLLDRHLLTREIDESGPYYRLLARRLIQPVRRAIREHRAAPATAEYMRAAERSLALGELDFAWAQGERALRAAADLRERAQTESLLGNVEHRCGNSGEALPHYRQAAELLQATGDNAAAAYQLAAVGQLLLAAGNPADALTELRAAVDRTPNDPWLQTQLALALWQFGDGRAAVAILNWVLTMDGGYPEALRARGEILADLGEARGAILDLDRSVPDRPLSRAARGLALAELGEHTAAAREITGAVADARRNGPVLLYAARAFDLAGDKVAAKDRARDAINATDPPLSPAHKQRAKQLAGQRIGLTKP
jgi:tetratricopeptide (TPR) repeat protein